jgi:hypothetical protein
VTFEVRGGTTLPMFRRQTPRGGTRR